MKSLQILTLAVFAALVGACSSTQVSNNAAPAAAGENQVASAEPGSPNAITCKTVVKTGTRIGTRTCKPNREWEQDARTSREAMDEIQRDSVHTSGMIGN